MGFLDFLSADNNPRRRKPNRPRSMYGRTSDNDYDYDSDTEEGYDNRFNEDHDDSSYDRDFNDDDSREDDPVW